MKALALLGFNNIFIVITSYFLLLINDVTTNCVEELPYVVRTLQYRNIKCTNVSLENLSKEIHAVANADIKLTLVDINFENLTSLDDILYINVDHLSIINNIRNIREDAFSKFRFLASLTVQESNIRQFTGFEVRQNNSRGDYGFTLNLTNNNIIKLSESCKNSPFLVIFLLKNNAITHLDKNSLGKCSKLKMLDLSYNSISYVDPDTFRGCTNLITLILSHNPIKNITKNTFVGLINLLNLDLSNSYITFVETGAFAGLINLERLILKHNHICKLPSYLFYGTRLQKLELEGNFIKEIQPYAFYGLNQVIQIDLSLIKNVSKRAFEGLISLEYLNLSNSLIERLEPEAFGGLSALHNLDLHNNDIRRISDATFSNIGPLATLNLSINPVNDIEERSFSGLSYLETLDVSRGNIELIKERTLTGLTSLLSLNICRNKLSRLSCNMSMDPLQEMQNLNLGYNEIDTIEDCAFIPFPNLTKLLLNQNKLSRLTKDVFSSFLQIKHINLSHNRFKYLDVNVFFSCKMLSRLDLGHNLFVNFNPKPLIPYLSNLEYIELSGNVWSCSWLINVLKFLTSKAVDARSTVIPAQVKNVDGIPCISDEEMGNHRAKINMSVTDMLEIILSDTETKILPNLTDILNALNELKLVVNITNFSAKHNHTNSCEKDGNFLIIDIVNKLNIVLIFIVIFVGFLCVRYFYKRFSYKIRHFKSTIYASNPTIVETIDESVL